MHKSELCSVIIDNWCCVYRDLRLMDNLTTSIIATWSKLVGCLVHTVTRLIFFSAPPQELMTSFSIWSLDILVVSMTDDLNVCEWMPEPIHSWALLESANQAMSLTMCQMPPSPPLWEQTIPVEQVKNMPTPSWDKAVTMPPLYEDAINVASSMSTSEDDGDDDDNEVFLN